MRDPADDPYVQQRRNISVIITIIVTIVITVIVTDVATIAVKDAITIVVVTDVGAAVVLLIVVEITAVALATPAPLLVVPVILAVVVVEATPRQCSLRRRGIAEIPIVAVVVTVVAVIAIAATAIAAIAAVLTGVQVRHTSPLRLAVGLVAIGRCMMDVMNTSMMMVTIVRSSPPRHAPLGAVEVFSLR